MTIRRARRASPGRLLAAVGIEAEDVITFDLAKFAQDLEEERFIDQDGRLALEVLFYFAESVRRGYVPHDAILHWLAERFARYLDPESGNARLDVILELAPAKRRRGKAGHDVREHVTHARRETQYVWRLAMLDLAGFKKAAVLAYLNDGVPDILPPMASAAGRIESIEKYVPKWRKSAEYATSFAVLKNIEEGGRSRVAEKLKKYAPEANRRASAASPRSASRRRGGT